jgi:hypothetical protein
MTHLASPDDLQFRSDFEALVFPKTEFKHREHLRLAYVYLAEHDTEAALERMRATLHAFIAHHGIDFSKYHETLTRAWILAVRHFMERTPGTSCFDDLIRAHPVMLDSKIMLTHYSTELLFSPEARAGFVEPDRDPIPRYG